MKDQVDPVQHADMEGREKREICIPTAKMS